MTLTPIRHYRVLDQLDDGASSAVLKAEDTQNDRIVAIKFLPFELKEDPEARQRFIAEAQGASNLDHPNICTVYDIGEAEDGRMFAALAFYEGETLKRRLEQGPLPTREALDIARQIAAGLGEAHEHGLVHRDLVPSNILLSGDQARILDFGLGKQVSQGGLTQIGWSLGTPEYMSPELIQGADADATGDLWSLGILLYEMISGQRPFTGANLAGVLTAVQRNDPTPLHELLPETPAAVDSIVKRLLAKNPSDRYASCQDLLADLGAPGSIPASLEPQASAEVAEKEPSAAAPATGSPSSSGAEPAASPDRTVMWIVLGLLAAVALLWLLLAGSSDGSLLTPPSGRQDHAMIQPRSPEAVTAAGRFSAPAAHRSATTSA